MNLLGAANYDPTGGAGVVKVTTALLAMTALDTTNLRIAFTIPAHGFVHVRMSCVHHGGTTTAQGFLGCLEGSTLRGRCSPTSNLLGTAIATTRTKWEVAFTLGGLTPGAVNWDAAYGVEIVSSAGGITYGGPNNTTTNDGFGGFNFEIWDPRPIPTAAAGAAGGLFIAGTNAATTITTGLTTTFTGNLTGSVASVTGAVGSVTGAVGSVVGLTASNLDATVSSRATQTSVDDVPTNAELATALGTADDAVLAQVALVKAKTDLIPAAPAAVGDIPTAAQNADAVWDEAIAGHAGAGSTGEALSNAGTGGTPPTASEIADEVQTRTIAAVTTVGAVTGLTAANLDATISSRASAANLATAQTAINDIPTNAELATALGTADDATLAQIALVKAKTDLIPAAPAAVGDIPTTAQIADKILVRNLAGGADGTRTVRDALRSLRNKTEIAGGILTVTEEDDATPAWTAAVTTAPGDPLTAIDPA